MPEERVISPNNIINDVVVNDLPGFPPEFYEELVESSNFYEGGTPIYSEEKVVYNNTAILDQQREGACTVFGISKASNEENYFDQGSTVDAMNKWREYIDKGLVPENGVNWWSMWWAMNAFKNDGIIAGWYSCPDPESVLRALKLKRCVYTGTNRCNWSATSSSGVFTPSDNVVVGHVFAIIGIDMKKREYIAANSWGTDWGKENGLFRIPFDKEGYLYSRIAIIDKIDNADAESEDIIAANTMKDMGIWNGKMPNNILAKMHGVLMVMRAVKKEFNDTKALADAQTLGIAKQIDMSDCTREVFCTMLIRAVDPNLVQYGEATSKLYGMGILKDNTPNKKITRFHAAVITSRFLVHFLGREWQQS